MKHPIRGSLLVALGTGAVLLAVGGMAQARRVTAAFEGAPDPWSSAGCWVQAGGALQLNGPACFDDFNHFYQVPLVTDNATSVAPSRIQGHSCGSPLGIVCSRGTTYNSDGTFFTAQATNCTDGTATGGVIAIPSSGTATLDTWQASTSGGQNCTYLSTVTYTP